MDSVFSEKEQSDTFAAQQILHQKVWLCGILVSDYPVCFSHWFNILY
nr:MAG TPA: hypothetical protein [Caudoviricetes sp.]